MPFFKATDGKITIFRATGRPNGFAFGYFTTGTDSRGEPEPAGTIGFSNTPGSDRHTAIPLQRAEHARLVALKAERVKADYGDKGYHNGPQDCWIRNSQLGEG